MARRHARIRAAGGRPPLSGAGGERTVELTSRDGVRLRTWLASPARPEGVMILCHGLSTDADEHGAFVALRDAAVRAGLAVARFDFRAHGESGGSNERLRLQGLRDDADAVADFAQAELGEELPLVALGVSFGGAPAVHLAATRPQAVGLVLWYPVIDYSWNFGEDARVAGTAMMRRAARPSDPSWSEFPVVGTAYHMPRELLRETRADPTPRTLRELNLPLLNYQGSRDQLIDPTPLRAIAAGRTDWTLRTAHGAGHGFIVWRPLAIWHTVRWSLRLARRAQAVRPPSTTRT